MIILIVAIHTPTLITPAFGTDTTVETANDFNFEPIYTVVPFAIYRPYININSECADTARRKTKTTITIRVVRCEATTIVITPVVLAPLNINTVAIKIDPIDLVCIASLIMETDFTTCLFISEDRITKAVALYPDIATGITTTSAINHAYRKVIPPQVTGDDIVTAHDDSANIHEVTSFLVRRSINYVGTVIAIRPHRNRRRP